MDWIKTWFNVLALPEAIERIRAGDLTARAAAITFDDGYANNLTVALPILQETELPATFFIATGYVTGGRKWHAKLSDLVRKANGPQLGQSNCKTGTTAAATRR